MPNISEMRESKFLKKEDVGAGALLTIESCQQHNVAKDGADPEMKWTLSFSEVDKPLVLNSTNIQLCAKICGSPDTDHWVGKKIVLYNDPNVSYQGKLIGGIRVRAPKTTAVKSAAAPIGGSQQSEIERLKAQLAAITGGVASVAVAPPSNTEVMVEEDEIPFAWLLPLILPVTALIGAGMLFA